MVRVFKATDTLCSRQVLLVFCPGPVSPSETTVSKKDFKMLELMINLQTMFVIPANVLSRNMSAQLIPPTPHLQHLL